MFKNMYEKVGEKIKAIATTICFLGMAVSVIYGIYMLTWGVEYIFTGLIVAVIGSFASWVSSLFTYGFGVLISNTEEIKQNTADTSKTALDIANTQTDTEKK